MPPEPATSDEGSGDESDGALPAVPDSAWEQPDMLNVIMLEWLTRRFPAR